MQQDAFKPKSLPKPVLVYGRLQCGWTTRTIRELTQNQVTCLFKDIDDKSLRPELNQVLAKAGITGKYPLPLVCVNNEVMLRPSVADVMSKVQS